MNGTPGIPGAPGVLLAVTGIWMILRNPVLATNILVSPLLNAMPFAPQQNGLSLPNAVGGESRPWGSVTVPPIQMVAWTDIPFRSRQLRRPDYSVHRIGHVDVAVRV